MMLSRRAVDEVLQSVSGEMFYHQVNRSIFEAIAAVAGRNVPVDVMLVADELRRAGAFERCGGGEYLGILLEAVPTASNASHYAALVRNAYQLRETIAACERCIGEAYGMPDAGECIAAAQEDLFRIARPAADSEPRSFEAILLPLVKRIRDRREKRRGIPTGQSGYDDLVGGFFPGEFGVVGARPSVGKTSWMTTVAANMVFRGTKPDGSPIRVLIFSLEMAAEALVESILCGEAGVDGTHVRRGSMDMVTVHQLDSTAADLYDHPGIWIDDDPESTFTQIASKVRRHVDKHGTDVVFVDYLQRVVRGRSEQRATERDFVSSLCRRFKTLARQAHVPVWVLSQLRREGAENPRPMISGFMESGYIESEADVAGLLWRRHYQDRSWPAGAADPSELYVCKNRLGPTGLVPLMFRGDLRKFEDPLPGEWSVD